MRRAKLRVTIKFFFFVSKHFLEIRDYVARIELTLVAKKCVGETISRETPITQTPHLHLNSPRDSQWLNKGSNEREVYLLTSLVENSV